MTDHTDSPTTNDKLSSSKYLTFLLEDEEYGFEILQVREIIQMLELTALPRMPLHIKGVINLRGKVIPVIDLRTKFGLPEVERTDQTCIIVVTANGTDTGIIVDRVSEVRAISPGQIEDTPSFGSAVDTDSILGIGRTGDAITILLDVNRILDGGNLLTALEADHSDHSSA